MSKVRYASVLGLGFGDCGKGRFVDALTRRWQAHTVVRFNGGAQAGHNVVTSTGHHHTFSQFGAGTLVKGVSTLLLDPMIVHPTALLVEAGALDRIGVHDSLSRIMIDGQCRVTTPYHQAAGRLRERLRGPAAHGTCGVGAGETVRHGLKHPGQMLRYRDLSHTRSTAQVNELRRKLQVIRQTLLNPFLPQCPAGCEAALSADFQMLHDETVGEKWLTASRALARQCPPASADEINARLTRPGVVVFEGAQGVLLDEWRGFHPHTTWSSINTAAVESVAARFGITCSMMHYGVLRSYLTRHGAGPLPTEDESLDSSLPEPHNSAHGWQGRFRRGHPDAVLLRYAIESAGQLSGLLVSHLDVFQNGLRLKWCRQYLNSSDPAFPPILEELSLGGDEDLSYQARLTNLLQTAQPCYEFTPITSAEAFLERVADVTPLPIALRSYGVQSDEIRESIHHKSLLYP